MNLLVHRTDAHPIPSAARYLFEIDKEFKIIYPYGRSGRLKLVTTARSGLQRNA